MYTMSSGDDSDDEPISTDRDDSQSNPSVKRREACYKICNYIKQGQL